MQMYNMRVQFELVAMGYLQIKALYNNKNYIIILNVRLAGHARWNVWRGRSESNTVVQLKRPKELSSRESRNELKYCNFGALIGISVTSQAPKPTSASTSA